MASKKKGGKRRPPQQGSRQRQAQQARKSGPAQQPGGSGAASSTESSGTGTVGGGSKPPRPAQGPKQAPKAKKAAPRERSGPTQAERLAAAERARCRKVLRTRALIAGVLLLLVGSLAASMISNRRASAKLISQLEAGSCEFDRRADPTAREPNNHVPSPAYEVNPPAGGNHLITPSPAGTYTAENTPPDGQLVHSLEHGFVVIWYRPDLPPEGQAQLRQVTDKHTKDVLLVPRPSLPTPVAASAWERRLLCDSVEVPALDRFVTSYRNKGPEKVEHP